MQFWQMYPQKKWSAQTSLPHRSQRYAALFLQSHWCSQSMNEYSQPRNPMPYDTEVSALARQGQLASGSITRSPRISAPISAEVFFGAVEGAGAVSGTASGGGL